MTYDYLQIFIIFIDSLELVNEDKNIIISDKILDY